MIDPNTIDGFGLDLTSRAQVEARVVQDARTPKEAKTQSSGRYVSPWATSGTNMVSRVCLVHAGRSG